MAPTRPAQKMTKASPGKVRPTRTQDRTKDLDILFLWQCLELFNEKYRVVSSFASKGHSARRRHW